MRISNHGFELKVTEPVLQKICGTGSFWLNTKKLYKNQLKIHTICVILYRNNQNIRQKQKYCTQPDIKRWEGIIIMKSEFLKNADEKSTRFTAKALLVCTAFIILTAVLNAAGVFILDKTKFTIVAAVCSVIMCIPQAALLIIKKYEDWMKYAVIACITLSVSIAYSVLTFHVIISFLFPLVISVVYFDKKLTIFTSILTAVSMTAAHIVSFYTSIVFDDPLVTLQQILIFGLLPRLLLFLVAAIICISLGNKAQRLFDQLQESNTEIIQSKNSLDTIMNVSRDLYMINSLEELADLLRRAIGYVSISIVGDEKPPVTAVGILTEKDEIKRFDDKYSRGNDAVGRDSVEVSIPGVSYTFPIFRREDGEFTIVCSNGIGMGFYNENKLQLYVAIGLEIDESKKLLAKNISVFYNNISTAITRTKINEKMFKTQESVIRSFAEISESKSRQTGQHVKRVSEYTRIMAAEAGFGESQCSEIAMAAMMHDIGKLMIPPEILEKPGKLTPEEFEVIKTHVTFGADLLKNSGGEVMHMARLIALQHHERWDGNGYLGYKGEEIDYISRFVAVADVFDALVSKRSYKEGWPPEEAYAEILRQKGKQFAPHAVDTFIKSYDKILETLSLYPDEVTHTV